VYLENTKATRDLDSGLVLYIRECAGSFLFFSFLFFSGASGMDGRKGLGRHMCDIIDVGMQSMDGVLMYYYSLSWF